MRKKPIIITMIISMIAFVMIKEHFFGERLPENRLVAMSMLSCLSMENTPDMVNISDLNPECHIDRIDRPSKKKFIAYNRQWNITLNFDRIEVDNQKFWTCKGRPPKLFPKQCR